MAKQTLKLNPMQVKNAASKDREYNLSDGDGLYLRVKPTGSKLWIFNYTQPITKKRKNTGLGVYPDVTLKQARDKADDYRELLKRNIDPLIDKQAKANRAKTEQETTFKFVADEWLELRKKKLASTTYKKNARYFEKDIYPVIGHYPIKDIRAENGIKVLKRVSGRGSLEIARKVSRSLNQVMTYGVNTGRIDFNPLSGISEVLPQVEVKHRPTLEVDQISELMQALRYSTSKVLTRCLIEFQLHTMTRPREASEAQWTEIDFDNRLWIIPAKRMKMRKEHQIPLTEQVLKILETVKPFSGHREYIFASHVNPNKPMNAQSANKALRDMGFTGRLVAHGLRALASTTLNENRFDDDLIETALAHQDKNKIRKAYNRAQYLEQRRIMMQWWSDYIEAAATGKPMQTGTKNLRVIN